MSKEQLIELLEQLPDYPVKLEVSLFGNYHAFNITDVVLVNVDDNLIVEGDSNTIVLTAYQKGK